MTALAEAFNNGERETLPRTIGGRYGLSSKSSARRAYWRSLMNSAARNPNHGLRWAFMMTLLTSRCHYRKIPCPAALNLKRYFTAWEATAAYPPRKIILKLSVILRRGMRKVISFMTLKSWRAHGIAPARQRKTHSFRLLNCSGGFCRLPSITVYR